jgi:hypothetical protein
MTDIRWYLTTSRFAIAAVFAAALAGSSASVAQSQGQGGTGAAPGGDEGAAQEFVDPVDPTSDAGGNLEPGMSSGEKYVVDTDSEEFDRYKMAAEEGDAEEAGQALAEASGEQEITTDYVLFVNEDLGVITVLTPEQIAEAANGN